MLQPNHVHSLNNDSTNLLPYISRRHFWDFGLCDCRNPRHKVYVLCTPNLSSIPPFPAKVEGHEERNIDVYEAGQQRIAFVVNDLQYVKNLDTLKWKKTSKPLDDQDCRRL